MQNLIKLIVQNGSLILFLCLQTLCLYWVVSYNNTQKKIYSYSSQIISNNIQKRYNNLISYFDLSRVADSVAQENAILISKQLNQTNLTFPVDSGLQLHHVQVFSAKVVNNSVDKLNNVITLDKGGKAGIYPGMGVLTAKGIIGIVVDTSAHFSRVMSVLNSNTRISGTLKRSGFFGSLVWTKQNPRIMNLQGIQKYADIRMGDTVIASGYSLFPKGWPIGIVDVYKVESGNFTFTIDVKLFEDLATLNYVYVIGSALEIEKNILESANPEHE